MFLLPTNYLALHVYQILEKNRPTQLIGPTRLLISEKTFTYTIIRSYTIIWQVRVFVYTVKLGNKELFDKEQIGIKEPFPLTNFPLTS